MARHGLDHDVHQLDLPHGAFTQDSHPVEARASLRRTSVVGADVGTLAPVSPVPRLAHALEQLGHEGHERELVSEPSSFADFDVLEQW